MENFRGQYLLLPNFPAVALYSRFFDTKKVNDAWRLIYQGQIAEGHGVEEIVRMMPYEVNGKPVHLVLKGWLNPDFEKKLKPLIAEKGLQNSVEFVGYTAYQELPKLTASCHVGIAIHTKNDIMNKTLGTASNKIYEYAASGLPVLYFDNEHFREHLGQYGWAFPTDVTEGSLKDCLQNIADDFEALSLATRQDFLAALNFEVHFQKVAKHLDLPIEAPRFSLSTQMHSI
jgi:glycosyltransferase involved in cell wall biosynthesis